MSLKIISKASRVPKVAVLVETATSWGRGIHYGIHDYGRKRGPWHLLVEARGPGENFQVPKGWRGDGIIASVSTPIMARELKALGIPTVNVSDLHLPEVNFPRAATDLESSAKMAATHFLERGYKHFAYFGPIGLTHGVAHQAGFARAAKQAGGDFALFSARPKPGAKPDRNLDLAKLGPWLQQLPKPVGLLTWNASSAREVMDACQTAGLLVPEEVAVLSGADDDLLCDLSPIPISGVLVAAEKIGYQAAQLLDRLMKRRSLSAQQFLLAPQQVVPRQSTDTLAIRDPRMVKAIGFIRQHVGRGMSVNEVARHSGISRRALERQFAQLLGRTPAEEIRRVHLEHARQLLAETDIPIPEVAAASGFSSPEYLAYAFRQTAGLSPLKYRQKTRSLERL